MEYLWLFLFFIAGFLIRIQFRLKNKLFGNDPWYHLLVIDYLKKHKKLPKQIDNFTIKANFAQPPVFYYLLSLCSKKYLLLISQFFCPLIDSLAILLVFFMARTFFDPTTSLLAAFIYAFSPTNIFESLPFTPRTLGVLLFGATIYAMYCTQIGNISIIIPILLVAILLNTSKFATEGLLFFAIGLSFLQLTGTYLIITALGAILAILLPGGYYLKVLKSHIIMLEYWKDNMQNRWKEKGFKRISTNLSKTLLNPWAIFPIIAFCMGQNDFFIFGSLIAIILCMATSFDQLAFLGDNFRYLTLGSFFTSIAAAQFIITNWSLVIIYLTTAVFIASIAIHFYLQNWLLKKSSDSIFGKESLNAFNFLKKIKGNILCIPTSISYITTYFTYKKIVFCDNDWKLCPEIFPKLSGDLTKIIKKYKVKYILKEKSQKQKIPGKQIFKNARFEVYAV